MNRTFIPLFIAVIVILLVPLGAQAERIDADTFVGFGTEVTVDGLDAFNGEELVLVGFPPDGKEFEETARVRRGTVTFEISAEHTTIPGDYDVVIEDLDGVVVAEGEFEVFEDVPADLVMQLLQDEQPVASPSSPSSRSSASSSKRSSNIFRASLLDEYDRDLEDDVPSNDYGYIDSCKVQITEQVIRINEQTDFSITALDRRNSQVRDYTGRMEVQTTDPNAQVPGNAVKFYASDRGQVELPLALMFATPGQHTVIVRDADDPEISCKAEVRVVGGSGKVERGGIVIESPGNGVTVGSNIVVSGSAPAYVNLELVNTSVSADGGDVIAFGESDKDGKFAFNVSFADEQTEYILLVREGEGGLGRASQSITLIVDATAPTLHEITLLPNKILPSMSFTVSVTASPKEEVEAVLVGGHKVVLKEESSYEDRLSVYQATLTAPNSAGSYAVSVLVRDSAGNETVRTKTLVVESSGLAVVQGVQAVPSGQDLMVSWGQVEDAHQYRIYFGASAADLSRHVDTGSPVTSARLTGLLAARTYALAVTALDASGKESADKSVVVSASPYGSTFGAKISSQINGAQLEWEPPTGAAVQGYLVEFGVQPGRYTEQRLVASSVHAFSVFDLINGVTYFVRLSAIGADGMMFADEVELTVVPGQAGQPGMHAAPYEPVPATLRPKPTTLR